VNAVEWLFELSLWAMAALLVALSGRGLYRYVQKGVMAQLAWGSGLLLAAGAMAIEAIVYAGSDGQLVLQAYTFLTAALVGALSLGATRVMGRPLLEKGYAGFMFAACAVLGIFCFTTPITTSSMVDSSGIITGAPPVLLLYVSSIVTFPATIVLLWSTVVALRRTFRWQTALMIAGALILAAGGTLYIGGYPIYLYYAEFVGIILLFLGLVSLSRMPVPAQSPLVVEHPN
jgi:hypothetical protein